MHRDIEAVCTLFPEAAKRIAHWRECGATEAEVLKEIQDWKEESTHELLFSEPKPRIYTLRTGAQMNTQDIGWLLGAALDAEAEFPLEYTWRWALSITPDQKPDDAYDPLWYYFPNAINTNDFAFWVRHAQGRSKVTMPMLLEGLALFQEHQPAAFNDLMEGVFMDYMADYVIQFATFGVVKYPQPVFGMVDDVAEETACYAEKPHDQWPEEETPS